MGTPPDGPPREGVGMSVIRQTTITLTCDRSACGRTAQSLYSPDEIDIEAFQFWARQGVEGGWPMTQRLLCKECVDELEKWLGK